MSEGEGKGKRRKRETYRERYMREWLSRHKQICFFIPKEEYEKLSLLREINNISVKELILDILRSRDVDEFLLKMKGRVLDVLEMKEKLEEKERKLEEKEKQLEARMQKLNKYLSYVKELEDTILRYGFSLGIINQLRAKYGFKTREE